MTGVEFGGYHKQSTAQLAEIVAAAGARKKLGQGAIHPAIVEQSGRNGLGESLQRFKQAALPGCRQIVGQALPRQWRDRGQAVGVFTKSGSQQGGWVKHLPPNHR